MTSDQICPICMYNIDLFFTLDCRHTYCLDCIREYVIKKIEDREFEIICPIYGCDIEITSYEINDVISDKIDLRDIYNRYKFSSEKIEAGHKYSMCPKCNIIRKKYNLNNQIYCSYCEYYFCSVCGSEHDDDDYTYCPNQIEVDEQISELMSALDTEDVDAKPCPVCKIFIERTEGCNSIRCKYCKIKFCWNCLQTNQTINKMDSDEHNCNDFDGYIRTESDDEYVDGYDSE
jgi:hypothetical protein